MNIRPVTAQLIHSRDGRADRRKEAKQALVTNVRTRLKNYMTRRPIMRRAFHDFPLAPKANTSD
jgi:hypothetical protein